MAKKPGGEGGKVQQPPLKTPEGRDGGKGPAVGVFSAPKKEPSKKQGADGTSHARKPPLTGGALPKKR